MPIHIVYYILIDREGLYEKYLQKFTRLHIHRVFFIRTDKKAYARKVYKFVHTGTYSLSNTQTVKAYKKKIYKLISAPILNLTM